MPRIGSVTDAKINEIVAQDQLSCVVRMLPIGECDGCRYDGNMHGIIGCCCIRRMLRRKKIRDAKVAEIIMVVSAASVVMCMINISRVTDVKMPEIGRALSAVAMSGAFYE